MGLLQHWLGLGPWRGEAGDRHRLLPPSEWLRLGLHQVQPSGLQRRKQHGHSDSGEVEAPRQDKQRPDFRARLGGLCKPGWDRCHDQAPGSKMYSRRLPMEPHLHPAGGSSGPRVLQRAVQPTGSTQMRSGRPLWSPRQDLDWGTSFRLQRPKPQLLWGLVPHCSRQVDRSKGWQRPSPCMCYHWARQGHYQVCSDQDPVWFQPGSLHGRGSICDGGSRLVPLHWQQRNQGATRGALSPGAPSFPRTSRQQAGAGLLEAPSHWPARRSQSRYTWLCSATGQSHQTAIQRVRPRETGQEKVARVTIILWILFNLPHPILPPPPTPPAQCPSCPPETLVTGKHPVKIHSERNHVLVVKVLNPHRVYCPSPMSAKSLNLICVLNHH